MAKSNVSVNLGSPLFLVFLVFLTLKLGQWGPVAAWSYWWVTAPLWIPVVVAVGVLLPIVILFVIVAAIFGKK